MASLSKKDSDWGEGLSTAFLRRVEVKWEKIGDRNEYPWSLPVFRDFNTLPLHPRITILVGENGSGKSTLVEGIAEAIGINAEGGTRHHSFSNTRHRSPIADYLRIVRGVRREKTEFFLRAESFFNVATNYEEIKDLYFPRLHYCSHGESFLRIALERFGPNGLYFLDEPESALSPQNLLTLICRINHLIKKGSQFIIATHSPLLMAYPGALVYGLDEDGIREVDYRTTRHFAITCRVLADPEGFYAGMLDGS